MEVFVEENTVGIKKEKQEMNLLGKIIFSSRWLQLPLYLGLIVAQGVYVYHFMEELIHLVLQVTSIDETQIMLIVLNLVDVVMIASLLYMVIVGGYETSVSRLRTEGHPDSPDWLSHMNAGTMKIKLAVTIITISSIHLLKTFLEAAQLDVKTIVAQVGIHTTLVLSAIAVAYVDKLMKPTGSAKH